MFEYSKESRVKLDTCHPSLVKVLELVIPVFDHTILEGARTIETQKEYVARGSSKTLNSQHIPPVARIAAELSVDNENVFPDKARAVDVVPHPHDWSFDKELLQAAKAGDYQAVQKIMYSVARWSLFVGHVLMAAHVLETDIIWGGDWDNDKDLTDQNFNDWPHFQLVL